MPIRLDSSTAAVPETKCKFEI